MCAAGDRAPDRHPPGFSGLLKTLGWEILLTLYRKSTRLKVSWNVQQNKTLESRLCCSGYFP